MSLSPAVVFAVGTGLLAGAAGAAVMLRAVYRQRAVAISFAVAALAAALWAGGYGLYLSPGVASNSVVVLTSIGAAVFPAVWFAFVLAYTGYSTVLDHRTIPVLAIVPAVLIGTAVVDAGFGLSPVHYGGPIEAKMLPFIGPPFVLHLSFLLIVGLGSIILLARTLRQSEDVYRRQTQLLLGATGLTLLGILGALSEGTVGVDLTPYFAAIAAGSVFFGTVRYPVFDVTPLARDRIVERLRDPIVVLDGNDRVIEANDAAKHWLDLPEDVVGDTAGAYPSLECILEMLAGERRAEDVDRVTPIDRETVRFDTISGGVGRSTATNGGTGTATNGGMETATSGGTETATSGGTETATNGGTDTFRVNDGGVVLDSDVGRDGTVEIDTHEETGCFRITTRSIGRPGTDRGRLIVMRDVTAEHRAERRFRSLIEHTTDLIMVLDRDGTIRYCSPSISGSLGYDPHDRIGRRVFEFVHPDDKAEAIERFDRAVETDEEVRTRVRFRKRDGTYRTYEWAVLDRLETPHVEGIILSARDVTRAHRYERQLRVMNRVLRHDLRNEMNVILGHTELLAEKGHTTHVNTIEDRARALIELGEKARDVDRALSRSVDREPTDLTTIVREEVTALSEKTEVVTVRTAIEPGVEVLADPSLRAAVRNAVENAIEHNDAPNPTVSVDLSTDGDVAKLSVSDNGPGLPEMERRVLNAGVETPLQHMSGLGLWLIVWTVEAIGGTVQFDSSNGSGTEVRFEFDLVSGADPDANCDG